MNIERSLRYLLSQDAPFMCIVKGRWGVGKTYYTKKLIAENRAGLKRQSYSYVSMFGISTIEEITQSIFLNTISVEMLGTPAYGIAPTATDDVGKQIKF